MFRINLPIHISVAEIPLNEIPESIWLWSAKVAGAVLGSAVSIAYLLPKGRREAAIRFAVGVLIGVIFGPLAANQISNYFSLNDALTRFELVMMGSSLASLTAWWALGILHRVMTRAMHLPKAAPLKK